MTPDNRPERRRLILAPQGDTAGAFLEPAMPMCAREGCTRKPVETVTRDGVEHEYCAGHAMLELARPARHVVIDPVRGDDWLDGWQACRDSHQDVIDAAVERGHAEGARSARRFEVQTVAVLTTCAFIIGVLCAAAVQA